jgi:hypothetical protein
MVVAGTADAQQVQRTKTPNFAELASAIKTQIGADLAKAENGVPRIVLGKKGSALVAAQPGQMTPEMIADLSRNFFTTTASALNFLPANAEVNAAPAATVGQAYNTVLTLSYDGIPVRDRKAHIAIGAQTGELLAMRNSLPAVEPNTTTPKVTADAINTKIYPTLGANSKVYQEPTLVLVASPDGQLLRLAYEVRVSEPDHAWRYTFDATNGALLEKKDLVVNCTNPAHKHESANAYDEALLDTPTMFAPAEPAVTVGGKVNGNVLYYNPFKPDTTIGMPFIKVIVNGKTTYADKDGNYSIPDVTYPLTISSALESRFFKINRADGGSPASLTASIPSGLADINWLASNGLVAERSAFASVHRVYQYVKSFDESFTAIDKKMTVNINVAGNCNAYYLPDEKTLNFFPKQNGGNNCSNTAEIADVVYHEYGHHYHHIRYAERGTNVVSNALGEAVADIVSNFMRDNSSIGEGFFGNGTILRNSKNNLKWPGNVTSDPHATGQILTGAVWDLRLAIGLPKTEYLFHESLKAVPDATDGGEGAEPALEAFTDVLLAFLLADDDDNNLANGTPNSTQIVAAFEKHGIGLSNLISLNVNNIADQDTIATAYPVDVLATYSGAIGSIDRDSVKLYYSVNNAPYVMINVAHQDGDKYNTSIPKLPAGSIVRYYTTARTTLEESGVVRSPRTGYFTFLVGYRSVYSDNAETNKNYTFGIETDDAETGIWERGIPHGTIWADNFFQQDTDHTAIGKYAYITGNYDTEDALEDALYDFRMEGTRKTTFETNAIDLSAAKNPMLKFWYYHRSEQVFTTSENTFRVTVSTNDGLSWKQAYGSKEVLPGWSSVTIPLSLATTGNSKVKIRFIAGAAYGTVVEAGVDDIEIVEPIPTIPNGGTNGVDGELALKLDLATFPNPVSQGKFSFSYSLPQTAVVQAELKNVMGSAVWSTNGELKEAGPHSESVSLDLPSGTYWLQLSTSMGNVYKQIHVVK